jgi:hypothetical protein
MTMQAGYQEKSQAQPQSLLSGEGSALSTQVSTVFVSSLLTNFLEKVLPVALPWVLDQIRSLGGAAAADENAAVAAAEDAGAAFWEILGPIFDHIPDIFRLIQGVVSGQAAGAEDTQSSGTESAGGAPRSYPRQTR